MSTSTYALLSIAFVLFQTCTISDAKVDCMDCSSIVINRTLNEDLDTENCSIKSSLTCALSVHIDYMNDTENYALINGISSPNLDLTDGSPRILDSTSIWFTDTRVQRTVVITCSAGTACGVNILKKLYKDQCKSHASDEQRCNHFLTIELTLVSIDFINRK
jgi:hypothetical protein